MECTNCGVENGPGSLFCSSCGTPFPRIGAAIYCTNCGSANPGDSQFCGSCGFEIAGSQTHAGAGGALALRDAVDAGIKIPLRDLGGLLQDTFRMYRNGFGVYVKIGLIAQIPLLVTALIPTPLPLTIVLAVAGFLVVLVAQGAIISAVVWHYLGLRPAVGQCYHRAWDRFWALLAGAILFILVLLVCAALSLIIIGIPLFFYFLVSRYYFSSAVILEGTGAVDSLSRSAYLVKGNWWWAFGIGIIFILILFAMGFGAGLVVGIATLANNTVGDVLLLVVEGALLPVGPIGATMVYFDRRTRKEGFTLGMLEAEMARGEKVSG